MGFTNIVVIIKKTPLRDGTFPIAGPITEMGVEHTFEHTRLWSLLIFFVTKKPN